MSASALIFIYVLRQTLSSANANELFVNFAQDFLLGFLSSVFLHSSTYLTYRSIVREI